MVHITFSTQHNRQRKTLQSHNFWDSILTYYLVISGNSCVLLLFGFGKSVFGKLDLLLDTDSTYRKQKKMVFVFPATNSFQNCVTHQTTIAV